MKNRNRLIFFALGLTALGVLVGWLNKTQDGARLTAVGHGLNAIGTTVDVGGFPVNLEPSPDGRFFAVTNSGIQQYLTIIDAQTGRIASRVNYDGEVPNKKKKDGLYFGLRFAKTTDGKTLLYASHGSLDRISVHELSSTGILSPEIRSISNPRPGMEGALMPHFQAGLALNSDGSRLYAVNNQSYALSKFLGSVSVLDVATGERRRIIPVPGFPLDIAAITRGAFRDQKLYVTSEMEGVVSVIDAESLAVTKRIRTGANPTHLLLDRDQTRLFVSNSSSDTISVIDVASDEVVSTLNVRPVEQRGLPGATPLGMGLSADETRLYVALADLDSVGVIDLGRRSLVGMIPVGWYPTAVRSTKTDLLVTVGKGRRAKNPNTLATYRRNNQGPGYDPRGDYEGLDSGPEIRFNERGLVAKLRIPDAKELMHLSEIAMANVRLREIPRIANASAKLNPGIEHVIYIVKENRTYDQFFGDFPQGNGDKNMALYGDDVVPNQRALARRFGLFDNFYACAEMSADGWSWATAGIASEYVQRNAQYEYSRRQRNYDYEGQSNGSPIDAMGLRNVNDPPGGYLWDACLRGKKSFRNYGLYLAEGVPIKDRGGKVIAEDNAITMRAFKGRAAPDYRHYDTNYADSEAWERHRLTWPKQLKVWGTPPAKNRFEAWKRDYDRLIREKQVPALMMVRFGNDHTDGTSPNSASPRAMLADNDYAVGQLVEAVSQGPLWKKTAIVIVEDDAQGGFDHVDGHRSICFVISPYVKRGIVDSRFYNTDSALRTVLDLLGLPPHNQMLATARPIAIFGDKPLNAEPYRAILPPKKTFTVNTEKSYRAADSAELFRNDREESASDAELADILWGDAKGPGVPVPKYAKSLR